LQKPVKVPFSNEHDPIYWTPLQAQALRQAGIETSGSQIRKPAADHRPGQLGFDKNSGLMRSNFRLVDKWDQLRDTNGIIEIPYKFGTSFAYPDLIKVYSILVKTILTQCSGSNSWSSRIHE